MSDMPVVAAVLVTYNRLGALEVSLPRLLAEPFSRIIVVDNASTDGTAAWLDAQADPRLTILRLDENLGGAGGFDAGLREIAADGRIAWTALMDDDAWPERGALARFAENLESFHGLSPDPLGAVAAAVYTPDGAICDMNRPTRNPWASLPLFLKVATGGREAFHLGAEDFASPSPQVVDIGSFVGFFLSREALEAVGPPDPGFFLYGDDTCYSLQVRQAGFSVVFAPTIRFTHDCGTLDANSVTRPLWKVYYLTRNGMRVARTASGPLLYPFALGWYVVRWLRKARHYTAEERPGYRAMLRRGLWDGLRGVRGRHPEFPPPPRT